MNLKNLFIITIGIISIYWVYSFFAGPESLNYIIEHKEKVIFLFIAHIPTLFFDALAWKVLMKKNYLSLYWTFVITWISQTAGKVTPTGAVTGEFVRIYLSIKKGMKTSEASSTVIGDLAIAALSLLVVAVSSFLLIIFKAENFNLFGENGRYITFSIFVLIIGSILFCLFIRKRVVKIVLKQSNKLFKFKLSKKTINSLAKFDFEMFKLSFRLYALFVALFYRVLGWICGALEIYIFFTILEFDVSFTDVIIIESFTGVMRAIVFFIPAGLGVQEFAFVIIGSYLGMPSSVSFSAAIGRRIREILVGVPAIIAWYLLFNKKTGTN